MFNKDTLRLVKKTFNRFFTLVCIVLIGVAFMMGLLATPVIQRNSVDEYYKAHNLFDIQLYSSYGFCDEDIKEIEKLEEVDHFLASKMVDTYLSFDDGKTYVARCRELNSEVNGFELIKGRMPSNDKEVLILTESNKIGEKIKVFLNGEDEIFDHLKYDEYTIVGSVKTPEYMSKMLSTSNLDNCDLNTVIYMNNDVFTSEYYTTVYLSLGNLDDINAFTNDYLNVVDEAKVSLEYVRTKQESYLKETILLDYFEEIEDGERELEEERVKGQKKLDDAKLELEDANIKLIAGQMQIDNYEAQIKTGQETIDDEYDYLDSIAPDINNAIKRVEEADVDGRSFPEIYASVTSAYGTYLSLQAAKSDGAKNVYSQQIANLEEANQRIDEEIAVQEAIITNAESSPEEIVRAQLNKANLELTKRDNEETITRLKAAQEGSYDSTIDTAIDAINESAGGDIEKTYADLTKLAQGKAQIEAGYAELEAAQETLDQTIETLNESKKELTDGRYEYNKGLKEYKDGIREFNEKIEEAEADIRKARQDLEELPDAHWIVLDRKTNYSTLMYESTCNQMEAICLVMPVLFFLVAALVCMTTMTRLVDEQRGQIGVFRALGFSNGQIIGKYLLYAFMASILGSIIGITIGMKSFPIVIYETWRLMYYLPNRIEVLPIFRLVICLLSFVILMETVTYFVVRKSLVEQPAQLMRPKAPKNAKKVFLEYIPILWDKLSFTGKITLRNLIRYKSRFFMTVIGVAGCTGLLVLGFGIKDSISGVINLQFSEIFEYQYTVNLDNDHTVDEIVEVLDKDLENDESVPYMTYSSKVYFENEEEAINLEVIDARDSSKIMGFSDKSSNEPIKLSNKGVFISEKFAKNLGIKKGDTITVESKDGIKADVRVEAIIHMYFQHYLFMSEDLYNTLFEDTIHYTNIAVKSNNDLDQIKDSLSEMEDVASITDFKSQKENFDNMIEALNYIILVIIVTSGALSFVVLINLTQVNISERIKEIATLKVLGFRNGEVNSYIFKEIMMLTAIGGIVGLPLGMVELKFVMNIINVDLIMFPTSIKLLSYIYSYAITFIFTLIVLTLTIKPLKKIEMVESLKSVE